MKRIVLCIVLGLGPAQPALADLSEIRPIAAAKLAPVAWSLDRKAFSTVHFDFDRDFLDSTAKAKLQRQASFIKKYPGIRFAVTGHTDKVGNTRYNEALGLRRAKRVVAYLVSLGVDRRQLQAMVSFGEDRPVVNVDDRERRNRRVTTTVIIPKRQPAPQRGTSGSGTTMATSGPAEEISPTPTSGTTGEPTGGGTTTTPTTQPAKPRPGNSAYGTGKPDAGGGNGDEPSGDPAGSVGHNRGGDETP